MITFVALHHQLFALNHQRYCSLSSTTEWHNESSMLLPVIINIVEPILLLFMTNK